MKRKEPTYKYNNVMLLDDNDLDNFINQKMIEANLFAKTIYVNTSGKSALEFLTNISLPASGLNALLPEVIFVDLNMPMMDGYQFINNLRESLPAQSKSIKIVILTSSLNEGDRQKASELSTDIAFLNKPLTKEMFSEL